MPRFAYTGRSAVGAVTGTLDGASAAAVADQLLARGVTPLAITADGESTAAQAGDSPQLDWRAWFKLATAYDAARDPSRGRRAMRKAIALARDAG